VWTLPCPLAPRALRELASARAQLSLLAGPHGSPQELLAAVGALGLEVTSGAAWTLHYERVDKFAEVGAEAGAEADRWGSTDVVCAVAREVRGGRAWLGQAPLALRLVVLEWRGALALCAAQWSRQVRQSRSIPAGGAPCPDHSAPLP
jgi:hypothetical protein